MSIPQTFRFASDLPPTFLTDITTLNSFQPALVDQLIPILLHYLSHTPDADHHLSQFATQHKINIAPLKNIVQACLLFFGQALKKGMNGEQVKEDMEKMAEQQIAKTLTVNELVDIEWKFGVTASSDSLEQIGTCFLQLKLVIDRGDKKENVLMEMTLPQFYQFLQQMQAANRQVQALTKQG